MRENEDHPLYDEVKTKYGKKFYWNCNTGQMTVEKKVAKRGRGGILADQMGLGKTIMTLSLIKKYPTLQSVVNENINNNNHHNHNKFNTISNNNNEMLNNSNNNSISNFLNNSVNNLNNSINKSLLNNNSIPICKPNLNNTSSSACVCMDCLKNKLQLNDTDVLGGTLIILPTSILDQWQLEITSLIGSQLRYYEY